jgi:histidine triad (HIT) family protein
MASLFTKIVEGEIPCHKVWEDDEHLAFLDIRPMAKGHTLIIPKKETDYLFDLSEEEIAAVWVAARKVARRLKQVTGCARICVGVWGYEVPHAHVHLIPTNSMADFPPPPGATDGDPEELAALARDLRF